MLTFYVSGMLFANTVNSGRLQSGGRTLQSENDGHNIQQDGWMFNIGFCIITWLLHLLIIVAVLVRILVFGEPVTRPHSENAVLFWRHRNQAENDLAKVLETIKIYFHHNL